MYDELIKRLRHSANLAERGLITPRSELCAAADAIEGLTALSRRQEVELVELTGELASKPRWVPVTERLPECPLVPAADVRPVVRGHNTGNARIFECSECGYGFNDIYLTNEHDYPIDPNFCPNCGADMRKEPLEEETRA